MGQKNDPLEKMLNQMPVITRGNNGFYQREEWVLPLDPKLLSRWIGYLSFFKIYPPVNLLEPLTQKASWIFLSCAIPKNGFLDLITEQRPLPETAQKLAASLIFGSENHELKTLQLNYWRTRDKKEKEAKSYPWWKKCENLAFLDPFPKEKPRQPLFKLGDYHYAWWKLDSTLSWEQIPKNYKILFISPQKKREVKIKN